MSDIVLILEDDMPVVERLKRKILATKGFKGLVDHVLYLGKHNGPQLPRKPSEVAAEALAKFGEAEGRGVLFVDLVEDPDLEDKEYGLTVLREFKQMYYSPAVRTMTELLQDLNVLIAIVTDFVPNIQDLKNVWGADADGIKPKVIAGEQDLDKMFAQRRIKATLPVITKHCHENVVGPVVVKWLNSSTEK